MTKTTTTAETHQRIPLAKLKLAPENARFGSKDLGDVPGLRLSIVTVGDLIDELKVYPKGDEFMVWDGGRRLAALNLATGKDVSALPPALLAGVPCTVTTQAVAALHSRATFVREGLDAAEEFANYKALLDAKHTPEMIAAACGVGTPRVRQLLRLCGVAPAIIEAFKAHTLALDVVEAFSISPDHAKQLDVWKVVKDKKVIQAWEIKRLLQQGAVGANDRIATFVGRDAYEKAGGKFLLDLFAGRDDEAWADGDLARKLYDEKLAALVEKVKAEGWAWVKQVDPQDYNYTRNLTQLPKPAGGKWTAETMAGAGAFIAFRYNGDVDVQRGWAAAKGAGTASGATTAKKPAQTDPARYGFSHKGHQALTEIATAATQVALVRKPAVAYDALLSHLAWVQFGPQYETRDGSASRLHNEQKNGHRPLVHVEGEGELEAVRQSYAAHFKPFKDRVAFCEAVAALKPASKAELLAYCFGQSLYASEEKSDWTKPVRWSHLGWIAAKAGVEPSKAWTPSAEFLKGGSRDALLDAVKQLGGPASMKDAKKGALVAWVAEHAKAKGWTPKLLATFTDVLPKAAGPADPDAPSQALKALAGAGTPTAIKAAPSAKD